jgi:general secretion pathway protein I
MSPVARRARGFSLLEVMMAVGILGLALTVILSAQGGIAAGNKSAEHMGNAVHLARCKMTEQEERLLKLGYPEMDLVDTDLPCCEGAEIPGFRCDIRVEKVQLPNPISTAEDAGASLSLSASASAGAAGIPGGLSGIGSALAQNPQMLNNPMGNSMLNNPMGGAGLNFDGGLQGIGNSLQQQIGGGGGAQGMLGMVMGMIYPSLKPLLEASIRRITITVRWKEGPRDKEFAVVQYVTNPQRGGFISGTVPSASGAAGAAAVPTSTAATGLPTSVPR